MKSVVGLMPVDESRLVCIVVSNKSRRSVINALVKGQGMAAAFETPQELFGWVGKLAPVRTKSGLHLWLTDKIRRCSNEKGTWFEPAGSINHHPGEGL